MKTSIAIQLSVHTEALWRFAYRLTRSTDTAADLVQKTCLRALEKQHLYNESGKLQSWLFKIQHSIWLNELKKSNMGLHLQHEVLSDESVVSSSTASQHNPMHFSVLLDQVFEFVEQLPEAQRSVVLLVSVEGFSYKDAADILDVPVGTVMSRLANARMAIGKAFKHSETGNIHTTKKGQLT